MLPFFHSSHPLPLLQVQFLVECRELSRGMGNLIKFMRLSISKIAPDTNEAEAKAGLLAKLQTLLEERVVYAAESIAKYVITTIRDGDVILTFGSSPLVRRVLLAAAQVRQFRLVVVDARPLNEGIATLTAIIHKVQCEQSLADKTIHQETRNLFEKDETDIRNAQLSGLAPQLRELGSVTVKNPRENRFNNYNSCWGHWNFGTQVQRFP